MWKLLIKFSNCRPTNWCASLDTDCPGGCGVCHSLCCPLPGTVDNMPFDIQILNMTFVVSDMQEDMQSCPYQGVKKRRTQFVIFTLISIYLFIMLIIMSYICFFIHLHKGGLRTCCSRLPQSSMVLQSNLDQHLSCLLGCFLFLLFLGTWQLI